jgi:hypothetical protein
MMAPPNEKFEKLLLNRWSRVKKDTKSTNGLFSYGNSILQVHGCIKKGNIIVSINPSCQHNFIDVRMQVLANNIQSTQVEDENVQVFKDLKLTMANMYFILIFVSLICMMWMLFLDILGWAQSVQ